MLYRDTTQDRLEREREQRSFVPRCCPFPECPTKTGTKFVYVRNGWHETKRAPFRVQRFRCEVCLRTFSTQTFSYDYWQKRPDLDRSIFLQARGCSGNRQIATAIGCGKSTVAEKISRLARHCLRYFHRAISAAPKLKGDLLFDGLGTFEHSQYLPFWLNLAVHRDSSLVLGFTESTFRRGGTMRPAQKRKRARLEATFPRRERNTIRRGTAELLSAIKPFLDEETLRLLSDEHWTYPLAIRDAGLDHVPHVTTPGAAQRTAQNPLFEINLADMVIRHGSSNQKRETIAFNKRRQAGLEKAITWATWKNFMRPRRVKRGGATPAMLAGLAEAPLTYETLFSARIFAADVELPAVWERQIRREIETPQVGNNRRHDAVFAY